MSDRLLLALAPIAAHAKRSRDNWLTIGILPNPSQQSSRVYAALAGGGGVVDSSSVARALEAGGFLITPISLTMDEAAFLGAVTGVPRQPGAPAWLVRCVMGDARIVDGQPRCGDGTLTRVDPAIVEREEIVTPADLAPVYAAAKGASVSEIVYVTTERSRWGNETFARARATVAAWDRIEADLVALDGLRARGVAIPRDVEAVAARARAQFVSLASPVSSFKRMFFDGELREVDPVDRMGEIVTTSVVLYAIVAIGTVAVVFLLAGAWEATAASQTALGVSMGDVAQPLAECIADPSLPKEQREACQKALEDWEKAAPKPPADPAQSFSDMLKSALPIVGIVTAAVYVGPVVRELSVGAAQGMRQRRGPRPAIARSAYVPEVV